MSQERSQIMTITPEMAARWLDQSKPNYRKVDGQYVKHLATMIVKGQWEFNGESIKFDENNSVIDGQHRLWACIQANKPIRSLAIFGIQSSMEVDRGRNRKISDELRNRGEKNVTQLAALISRVRTHEIAGIGSRDGVRVSVHEALDCLKRRPDIRDYVMTPKITIMPRGLFQFFGWLFHKVDHTAADEFFEDFLSGAEMKSDDPAMKLRTFFIREEISGKISGKEVAAAVIIKAWNARLNGETIGNLSWRRYGRAAEDFPVVKGDPIYQAQKEKKKK